MRVGFPQRLRIPSALVWRWAGGWGLPQRGLQIGASSVTGSHPCTVPCGVNGCGFGIGMILAARSLRTGRSGSSMRDLYRYFQKQYRDSQRIPRIAPPAASITMCRATHTIRGTVPGGHVQCYTLRALHLYTPYLGDRVDVCLSLSPAPYAPVVASM